MEEAVTRRRVVVVDDDPETLEAMSIILGDAFTVFAYTSAAEAVQAVASARPDVLVLDIGMGPVDGVQCLEAIRAISGYRNVPAVAVTGFARAVERRRLLERGFQAVVVKPVFDLDELTALITRLASAHAQAAAARPRRPGGPSICRPAPSHLDPSEEVSTIASGGGDAKGPGLS